MNDNVTLRELFEKETGLNFKEAFCGVLIVREEYSMWLEDRLNSIQSKIDNADKYYLVTGTFAPIIYPENEKLNAEATISAFSEEFDTMQLVRIMDVEG